MQMEKFVRRAQKYVGEGQTVDAVTVIQRRPPLAIAAGVGAFVVVAIILNLIGLDNVIIVGALGGGALGAAMASQTKNYYLAGVGNEVQMIRLSTWGGQPESVEKTLPRPFDSTISKGLINKTVEIDGEKFILGRPFAAEFEALKSQPA